MKLFQMYLPIYSKPITLVTIKSIQLLFLHGCRKNKRSFISVREIQRHICLEHRNEERRRVCNRILHRRNANDSSFLAINHRFHSKNIPPRSHQTR